MENRDLFQKADNGYNCEQVEQYINVLKAEYKKVFEYAKTIEANAKAIEANNEKLKKICRSLSDENKALKANGATAAPVDSSALASIEKIAALCDEIAKENAVLHSNISK